jgi:hypothetical protein
MKICRNVVLAMGLALVCLPQARAGGVVRTCDETSLRTALSGGGFVSFACSGTISLSSTINISANTTIDGSEHHVTISGGNAAGVFFVNTGINFGVNRVTIANGNSYNGGGIYNAGTLNVTNSTFSGNTVLGVGSGGGGIYNAGTLTVTNSIFSANSSGCVGGGIYNGATLNVTNSTFSGNTALGSNCGGGAIYNATIFGNSVPATVIIADSTFSSNSAPAGGGGAILNVAGTVTLTNSTIFGNSVLGIGGAILNEDTLTVTNSTFSGNSGPEGGGGITEAQVFASSPPITLRNSIIANNPSGGNCGNFFGGFDDGGGNLVTDNTCGTIPASPDPLLGPLQNNGGRTQTMALSPGTATTPGSPAIGAAVEANCPVSDQRGFPRPFLKDKLTAVFDLPGASNPPAQPAPWGSLKLALNANGTIGANLTMSPGLDLGILLLDLPSSATVSGLPANWIFFQPGACAGNGFGCYSSFVATDFNGIAGFFGVGLGGIVPSPLSNLSFTISTPSGFSGVDQLISGSSSFVIGIVDPTTNTVTGVAGGSIVGCSIGAYEPGTLFRYFHISDDNTYLTAASFGVRGAFTLGTDSDGGVMSSNGAQFRFGTFSTFIPPNSFTGTSTLTYVNSAGTFRMSIQPLWGQTYAFSARGSANMTGTTRPILVQLTVGDDGGTTHTPAGLDDVTAPTLTSISPNTGAQGTTVNVTLTGTGLTGVTAVNVSGTGVTVSNVVAPNDTTITGTFTIAPSAATGARNVSVTTPAGTSNAVTFTVVTPPPTLTSISPNPIQLGPTYVTVTLTGTNLLGVSFVSAEGPGGGFGLGQSLLSVMNNTTVQFTILTAALRTGTWSIYVTGPGGTSNTVTFTVVAPTPPPTLTSISPPSGVLGTIRSMTLTGTNLAGATAVAVSGGGVTCTVTGTPTSTTVTANCAIANGASLTARNVFVTTPGGTSNSVTFNVLGAAVAFTGPSGDLTSINPTGTITVTNTAIGANAGPLSMTAAPTIATIVGQGTFSITGGGGCTATTVLAPGQSCTIIVQYMTTGVFSQAAVTISDVGAATSTQTVSIIGD